MREFSNVSHCETLTPASDAATLRPVTVRIALASLVLSFGARSLSAEPFRFHMFTETHSVDPHTSASPNSNYLFHLLYRGLYSYHSKRGLQLAGAEKCERESKRLTCTLNTSYRWSTGEPVKAGDYVQSFRRLIDPQTPSHSVGMIFTLNNAREIFKGAKAVTDLGVSAPDDRTLVFDFAEDDFEFEYKLIHPSLTPHPPGGYLERTKSNAMAVNGPYKVSSWKAGSHIKFEPNPHYPSKAKRPMAEAWFVDEDTTALRMYEAGKLNFLRRLTATEVPRFKGTPQFFQVAQARFDYIGFGPELKNKKSLRTALVNGVDFKTFLNLFFTISPPGCPSLPARYFDRVECMKPNFAKARASAKEAGKVERLDFQFSKMGGDDIARAAEWFQGQWKKNAGINVELMPQEQGVYLKGLRVKPPPIFRKGVSLDRPTCMAGLEIFTKDDPENFIQYDDPKYDRLVRAAGSARGTEARQKACRLAVAHLLKSNRLIPLGEMYFTILVKPHFTGWDLNELNQLDLSQLEEKPH